MWRVYKTKQKKTKQNKTVEGQEVTCSRPHPWQVVGLVSDSVPVSFQGPGSFPGASVPGCLSPPSSRSVTSASWLDPAGEADHQAKAMPGYLLPFSWAGSGTRPSGSPRIVLEVGRKLTPKKSTASTEGLPEWRSDENLSNEDSYRLESPRGRLLRTRVSLGLDAGHGQELWRKGSVRS